MKVKKGLMLGITGALVLSSLAFVGCGKPKLEKLPYTAESVSAQVDQFANREDGNGIYIDMLVSAYLDDNGLNYDSYNIRLGVSENKYYFMERGNEYIFDFSDNTKFVKYEKSSQTAPWQKTELPYDVTYDFTHAKEAMETVKSSLVGVFSMYTIFNEAGFYNKGKETVAGRACTKYEYTMSVNEASASISYWIENETGFCLKSTAKASEGHITAMATYECLEYLTNYTVQIPTIV